MTTSQLILLGLVVIAAVVAGYFIGRWAADREHGARAARPNPLPAPGDVEFDDPVADNVPAPRQRRGAPPPASAGGDHEPDPVPAPRQRSAAPPPAAAGGDRTGGAGAADDVPSPRRTRRGPPPPAAAGVMGGGDRDT
jgi:hypothetical protein